MDSKKKKNSDCMAETDTASSCTSLQEPSCNDTLLAPTTQVTQPSLDSGSLESSTSLQVTSRASIEADLQDSTIPTVLTLSNSVVPFQTQSTQAEITSPSSG